MAKTHTHTHTLMSMKKTLMKGKRIKTEENIYMNNQKNSGS